MKPGFEDFMAIELKREIAQRYFGFRKMIEEDTLDFMEKMKVDKKNREGRLRLVLLDEIGAHLHPRWRCPMSRAFRPGHGACQAFTLRPALKRRLIGHQHRSKIIRAIRVFCSLEFPP